MEVKFSDLKKKKVVNIPDGKMLGYITDLVMDYPEGKILYFVCGDKKPLFKGEDITIGLCAVNKIGDDAVLVCVRGGKDDGFTEAPQT